MSNTRPDVRPRLKLAVCVGINYRGTNNELAGCINDADDWASVLRARGYTVTQLIEQQATRWNILTALANMLNMTRWGDRVVFTYSGHGTWLPDLDGDEKDARDEALVPYDYKLITDDDIHATITAHKRIGVRLLTVSDSCFSGSVTRLMARGIGKPRFIDPLLLLTDPVLRARAVDVDDSRPVGKPRNTGVLLTGCRDDQVSYDAFIGGRARGAMSWAALTTLADTPTSYRAWHDGIRTLLPSDSYPQDPQLVAGPWQRRWMPLD